MLFNVCWLIFGFVLRIESFMWLLKSLSLKFNLCFLDLFIVWLVLVIIFINICLNLMLLIYMVMCVLILVVFILILFCFNWVLVIINVFFNMFVKFCCLSWVCVGLLKCLSWVIILWICFIRDCISIKFLLVCLILFLISSFFVFIK